jgi:hypothetical protein
MMLKSRYLRAALLWGLLFLVSLAAFLYSLRGWNPLRPPDTGSGPTPGEPAGVDWALWSSALGTLASCLTAGATLGGLAWTVAVGWRREQRDEKLSDLEQRRLENELEKQRIELDRLKGDPGRHEES